MNKFLYLQYERYSNFSTIPIKCLIFSIARKTPFFLYLYSPYFVSLEKISCISAELFHASMKILRSICIIFVFSK